MRPAARLHAATAVALCLGCASGREAAPEGPPLLFVRARGVWAPEDLNRDVSECIGIAHEAAMADRALLAAPPGTPTDALRERVVACMDERGWATGSSLEPEEWAQ